MRPNQKLFSSLLIKTGTPSRSQRRQKPAKSTEATASTRSTRVVRDASPKSPESGTCTATRLGRNGGAHHDIADAVFDLFQQEGMPKEAVPTIVLGAGGPKAPLEYALGLYRRGATREEFPIISFDLDSTARDAHDKFTQTGVISLSDLDCQELRGAPQVVATLKQLGITNVSKAGDIIIPEPLRRGFKFFQQDMFKALDTTLKNATRPFVLLCCNSIGHHVPQIMATRIPGTVKKGYDSYSLTLPEPTEQSRRIMDQMSRLPVGSAVAVGPVEYVSRFCQDLFNLNSFGAVVSKDSKKPSISNQMSTGGVIYEINSPLGNGRLPILFKKIK